MKNTVVRLRTTEAERDLWVETARGEGMTLSDWIRTRLSERGKAESSDRRLEPPDIATAGPTPRSESRRRRHGARGEPATGKASESVETPPPTARKSTAEAGGVEGSSGTTPPDAAGGASTGQEVGLTASAVDTSDFKCSHEPYASAGRPFCHRCGKRI